MGIVNLFVYHFRTPLMYASLIGLKDAVSTLLQHGANPLLRDTNGHQGTLFNPARVLIMIFAFAILKDE